MKSDKIFDQIEETLKSPPKLSSIKIYTKENDIPVDKLNNAISAYNLENIDIDDVLILVDTTAFGSAKTGMIFTLEKIYLRELGEEAISIYIKDIEQVSLNPGLWAKIRIEDKRYPDDPWIRSLSPASKKDIELLAKYINKYKNLLVNLEDVLREEEQEKLLSEQNQNAYIAANNSNDEVFIRLNKLIEKIDNFKKTFSIICLMKECSSTHIFMSESSLEEYNLDFIKSLFINFIYDFKFIQSEYVKLSTLSEILETNQSIIQEKLSTLRMFISPYKTLINNSLPFFSKVFNKELFFDKIIETNLDEFLIEITSSEYINNIIDSSIVLVDLNIDRKDEVTLYQENTFTESQISNTSSIEDKDSFLLTFINNNLDTIIKKSKETGVSISISALENDDYVIKVANYIYAFIPAPMRIFLNIRFVENFLLKNRYWLINKLK